MAAEEQGNTKEDADRRFGWNVNKFKPYALFARFGTLWFSPKIKTAIKICRFSDGSDTERNVATMLKNNLENEFQKCFE